jgi:hypothetical protein
MSGSIKPGVTLAGSLVAKGQTDTVSFVATAGYSYELDVASNATSTLRPEVRIIDASGAVITNIQIVAVASPRQILLLQTAELMQP